MKADLIYADHRNSTRDDRWEISQGKVFTQTPDLYNKVYTYSWNAPVGPFDACEEVFALFNMPGGLHEKNQIRSMSIGDLVVLEFDNGKTEVYVCSSTGFEEISHDPQMGSFLEEITKKDDAFKKHNIPFGHEVRNLVLKFIKDGLAGSLHDMTPKSTLIGEILDDAIHFNEVNFDPYGFVWRADRFDDTTEGQEAFDDDRSYEISRALKEGW